MRRSQTRNGKEMEEGLGAFLDSAGFRSQFEIRPIEQKKTCDYLAPNSADWEPCGKKATFAKYILDSTLVLQSTLRR